MTPTEYDQWRPGAVAHYADEHIRAGSMPRDTAHELAEKQFADLLPDGVATPDHHLLVPEVDGSPVGLLWLFRRPDDTVYVYDVAINEDKRGHGLGRQLMLAGEDRARELGATAIKLHVFGDNTVARRLYRGLGFTETNVMMAKSLIGPEPGESER